MKKSRRVHSFFEKIQRVAKFLYFRLIRIQATPENIARGLAAGVFSGLLPILPVQTVAAVAFAMLVGGSKIAAAIGTWISNPLNWVPFYMLFYYIGTSVLPFEIPKLDLKHVEFLELLERGPKLVLAMMVGGLVVAIPSTIISYFVSLHFIRIYQNRKKKRLKDKELKKLNEFKQSICKDKAKHEE